MTVSSSLRGLIIDLITPLSRGGDIDGPGLGWHLDNVLPHVQGLLLASPYVGEGKNLMPAQKEELLEKALVVVRGRVPILFWVSGETVEETSDPSRAIADGSEEQPPVTDRFVAGNTTPTVE